jgi:lysophospholipase L1-like esterase
MSKWTYPAILLGACTTSILAGVLLAFFLPQSPLENLSPQNLQPSPQISALKTTFGDVLSQATKSASPSAVLGTKTQGPVTIAIVGDSMVDTLGRDLFSLSLSLSQYYPKVTFNLLNYGVGASTAEQALPRLIQEYEYQGQKISPLLSTNPDIVIIESFAYNRPQDSDRSLKLRRQTLAKIISEIKSKTRAEVLMLVTIAPNDQKFAAGIEGITWDENQRKIEAQAVRQFLEDAIKYANEAGLPLIDAYTPSLDKDKNGKEMYVNPVDNIHPSQAGIELVSDLAAQKIQELGLVEKSLSRKTP